jgi:hypothetical protein
MGKLCCVSGGITYPIMLIKDVACPGLEGVLADYFTRNRLQRRLVTLLLFGRR